LFSQKDIVDKKKKLASNYLLILLRDGNICVEKKRDGTLDESV
jgi:hypothetical protein